MPVVSDLFVCCLKILSLKITNQSKTKQNKTKSLAPQTDKIVAGERVPYLAAVAKLKAGRLSRVVSDSCLQFFGGMGYTAEAMISRCYRDVRPLSIVGGSDETMLMIIANEMVRNVEHDI